MRLKKYISLAGLILFIAALVFSCSAINNGYGKMKLTDKGVVYKAQKKHIKNASY